MNLDFSPKFGISALTSLLHCKHNLYMECRQRPPITTFLPFAKLRTQPKKRIMAARKKATKKAAPKKAAKKAPKKAAKKAPKKAAKKGKKGKAVDLIISKSRTKNAVVTCNVSGDFYAALDGYVREAIASAEARATANGRKTLRPQDL